MAKPRPVKARPSTVSVGMTTADAFACIANECLDHLRANEPALVEARHPEAVHQARVALRKLRAALALFRGILKKSPVRAARLELKQVFEILGRCRDLDVFMAGPGAKGGHGKLPKGFKAAREAAYEAAIARLRSADYSETVGRFRSAIAEASWLKGGKAGIGIADQPVQAFARARLDERLDAVLAEGGDLAEMTPEARHRLRIEVKTLRYAADFFAGLFAGKAAEKSRQACLTAVKTLQEELGALNDLAMAETMADNQVSPVATERQVKRHLKRAAKAFSALADAGRFWVKDDV